MKIGRVGISGVVLLFLSALFFGFGVYAPGELGLPELGDLSASIAVGCFLAFACLKWIWPRIGEWVADLVYNDRRIAGDDPLEQLARDVRRSRSEESMSRLRQFAEENAGRTRVWTECAAALNDAMNRPSDAADVLETGAERVPTKEDKALLLYRAAALYDKIPGREEKARELWRLAVERFPMTTYGQMAAERLGE